MGLLAALLDEPETDVPASLACPREPWRQMWSTTPLERLNTEGKRRTTVGGICPTSAAAIRLVGALLAAPHDEWPVGRRSCGAESMARVRPGDAPPWRWRPTNGTLLACSPGE